MPNIRRKIVKKFQICSNTLCSHNISNIHPISISSINSIDDLIKLGQSYHCVGRTTYKNIDLLKLFNCIPALVELNNLMFIDDIKNNLINHILFCLKSNDFHSFMNIAIFGNPGVGKTSLAKILGQLYKHLGIISNGIFHQVSRSDLIAKYLGQTAQLTQKVIDNCMGGVVFIDEVYSLGSPDNKDSFSKECIDTITLNLTEKKDILFIIAGYETDVENCFFNANKGLSRRFPFKYYISNFSPSNLFNIFKSKLLSKNFILNSSEEKNIQSLFISHNCFHNNIGDVDNLIMHSIIIYNRNLEASDNIISFNVINSAFKNIFKSSPNVYSSLYL